VTLPKDAELTIYRVEYPADHREAIVARAIIITRAQFHCPSCDQWKPASFFGLRAMADGTVRNQSQCIECR
jgi:hypothetical protein